MIIGSGLGTLKLKEYESFRCRGVPHAPQREREREQSGDHIPNTRRTWAVNLRPPFAFDAALLPHTHQSLTLRVLAVITRSCNAFHFILLLANGSHLDYGNAF